MSTTLLHEDPELQQAFRAGRRDALERVYRAYARSVERYLQAITRASSAREAVPSLLVADLVQEVFIRAFSSEARRSYEGRLDYGHYLSVIARNCFVDLMRARRREIITSPDDLPFDLADAPEPEDWCDAKTLEVLEIYLRELAPEVREIYQRRFVLELSQVETAALLGITRRAVRTAERRLRAGLRKALARAGIPLRRLPARKLLSGGAQMIPVRSRGQI